VLSFGPVTGVRTPERPAPKEDGLSEIAPRGDAHADKLGGTVPPRLAEAIDALDMSEDRSARVQMLIDIARRFRDVPPSVATRPFDRANRVKDCESDAYVWAAPRPDGTLDYHFAVENPQGVSARALAVLLGDALNGRPIEEATALSDDIVYEIFGRELSMGKAMGLMGIAARVRHLARHAPAPAGNVAW
jgi:cysteine desulfuration protein SufE